MTVLEKKRLVRSCQDDGEEEEEETEEEEGVVQVEYLIDEQHLNNLKMQNTFMKSSHGMATTTSNTYRPWMAFFESAADGDVETMMKLLECGLVDLDETDVDGFSALMIASAEGERDIVLELLRMGASVTIPTIELKSVALHFAAKSGDPVIVKEICDRLGDSQTVDFLNVNADTPLVWACIEGRAEAVKVLLSFNADPNVMNHYGATTLMCAVMIGENADEDTDESRASIVQMLLEKNSSLVNSQDRDGSTAMHLAASCGYIKCVKALLKGGADITIRNAIGQTPLEEAEQTGCTGSEICVDHLRVKWKMLEEESQARMLSVLEMDENELIGFGNSGNLNKVSKKSKKKSKKSKQKQKVKKADIAQIVFEKKPKESNDRLGVGPVLDTQTVDERFREFNLYENAQENEAEDGNWTTVNRKKNGSNNSVTNPAFKDERVKRNKVVKSQEKKIPEGRLDINSKLVVESSPKKTDYATPGISIVQERDVKMGANEDSGNIFDDEIDAHPSPERTQENDSDLIDANDSNGGQSNLNFDEAFSSFNLDNQNVVNSLLLDENASGNSSFSFKAADDNSCLPSHTFLSDSSVMSSCMNTWTSKSESLSTNAYSNISSSAHSTPFPPSKYDGKISCIGQLFSTQKPPPPGLTLCSTPSEPISSSFSPSSFIGSAKYDSSFGSSKKSYASATRNLKQGDETIHPGNLDSYGHTITTPSRRPTRLYQYIGNPKNRKISTNNNTNTINDTNLAFSWAKDVESENMQEVLILLACGICQELVFDNVECPDEKCSQLYCKKCLINNLGSNSSVLQCHSCRGIISNAENCRHNALAQKQAKYLHQTSRKRKNSCKNSAEISLESMKVILKKSCPQAVSLALSPEYLVPGVGLSSLSMGQLDMLEEVHKSALSRISDAKINLMRLQERMFLQEQLRTQRDISYLAENRYELS